jgi:hypothetical protein
MKLPLHKTWFVARYFSWGWYPETWEGWAVCTLYVLIVIGGFLTFAESFSFLILLIISTMIFLVICKLKERQPNSRQDSKERTWKAGKLL